MMGRLKPPLEGHGLEILRATILATLFLAAQPCEAIRAGPDGRTRALVLGDVIEQYGTYNSFTVVQFDPAVRATMVPTRPDYIGGYENARRNLRLYMPRTYQRLLEDYDVIISSDADRRVFASDWVHWMSDSVIEEGLGILWLGSIESEIFVGWQATTVADVLPATQAPGQFTREEVFWFVMEDPNEELMKALPWTESPPLANVNAQVPRPESELWASVDGVFEDHPLITYWEIGKGAALNFASKFPVGVMPWAKDWDLFPQAMIYLLYRTADKPIPEDPYMFERVTHAFIRYHSENSLLESILAWVEKFGGSTRNLRERLRSLEELRLEAEEAYMNGDFDEALALLGRGEEDQEAMRAEAIRAKDAALIWIYVTEWCVLMGTLLISSYILWTLMVRRRLYREVGLSRLEAAEY
jgi:uncharacterized membrane protein